MDTARTAPKVCNGHSEQKNIEHSPSHHHHQSGTCCQGKGHHFHVRRVAPDRTGQRNALWYCLIITVVMMAVEIIAGYRTGSLMLLSDGLHMLSHAVSLAVSLLAVMFTTRKPSDELPFGWYRMEIVAALLNGILLLPLAGWIIYESFERMMHPDIIRTEEMIFVAILGLIVNLITAGILHRTGVEDLNTRSAYLHMLGDLFSSVAIIAGGIVMLYTGWMFIDPMLSTLVAILVLKWSWALMRDSLRILLEGKPDSIDSDSVKRTLKNKLPEIKDIHDMRIWEITSQYFCCTLHVVFNDMLLSEVSERKSQIRKLLQSEFNISHVVIEVESGQLLLEEMVA
ncbi:MAG: cation diffusion facilitator family transporter [Calditrichota bacterium]